MAITRTAIFVLIGALGGAALGGSKVLCRDGTCVVRGTWYGTGTVGGLLGMSLASMLPIGVAKPRRDEADSESDAAAARDDGAVDDAGDAHDSNRR